MAINVTELLERLLDERENVNRTDDSTKTVTPRYDQLQVDAVTNKMIGEQDDLLSRISRIKNK